MRLITLFATVLLLALAVAARADQSPNFDDDAKPILRQQPGLLEFVEAHYKVKDTGTAKYPGKDDRPPGPPFMFRAKLRGEPGPYHLMLLIQPGPVNHILNVVDMNRVHLNPPSQAAPAVVQQPAPPPANPPAARAQTPASQTPAQTPTSDTPSGPILAKPGASPSPATAPSLEPPPDPAPTAH